VLLLVPTVREAALLYPQPPPCAFEVIGFGPVEAAVGAMAAIAAHPDAAAGGVCLVGTAGSYDPDRAPVGAAFVAGSVRCHGIGIGEGPVHVGAASLGWTALDLISLAGDGEELLTVTAAAAGPEEVAERRRRYPSAVAEEMEGYAVAMAAARAGVRVEIVRGISNVAGRRDGWQLDRGLAAARALFEERLG
jgi:futalosine hydrolase